MKKYIKWILLVILIISILITLILFIDFKKQYDQGETNGLQENEVNMNVIYDKIWNYVSMSIYEDGVLNSKDEITYTKYMMLNSEYITYCDTVTGECEMYNYVYQNDKISMPIDCFVFKGDYYIEFDKENLYLSQKADTVEIIHHFEVAKG